MWKGLQNNSKCAIGNGNSSEVRSQMVENNPRSPAEMADPVWQALHAEQRNVSTAASTHSSGVEESLTRSSGIIPEPELLEPSLGQKLFPDPEWKLHPFPVEPHSLGFGGADPPGCWRSRPDEANGTASSARRSRDSIRGPFFGAIAATLFIIFLLALYAALWRCMVSPPQRKHRKVRVRIQQRVCV